MTATLDRLSNGLLLINVVTGGDPIENKGDGIFLDHDERYAVTREFLNVYSDLLAGKTVNVEGQHIRIEDGRLLFNPVQSPRPPLYFGGSSDAGIDVAVDTVDKYLTWGEPPAQVAEKIAKAKAVAAQRGRKLSFGIRLHVIVRETNAEAWKAADELIQYVTDDTIVAAQKIFARMDSVGQQRMAQLHGGRRDKLEISPNLWAGGQLVIAHAALAEPAQGRLRHDQRASRAMFDLAGADQATTRTWIGDWSLALEGERYVARIPAREFSLDLAFEATQPILLQGQQGYSRKGPEVRQASWYYSRPQLAVRDRIVVGGRARDVEGRAWLDHEWSSEVMAQNATGWDWIGINLDDGGALMAFRMCDRDGAPLWTGGARRGADGRTEILAPEAVRFAPGRRWISPRTGYSYPVEFVVNAGGVDYALAPLMDDQELDSRGSTGVVYWEGAVTASVAGRAVGRGYLELTGYGSTLRI